MNIRQRDIIELAFYTGRTPQNHPAIVVSVDEIFEMEGFFYAILLSTKNRYPEFTIEITPDMINNPRNHRTGFAICHMVQQFSIEDVVTRSGASLKIETFQKVVKKSAGSDLWCLGNNTNSISQTKVKSCTFRVYAPSTHLFSNSRS